MTARKQQEFFRARNFLHGLRILVESLPSEVEKQQMALQLEAVIGFLKEVKERIVALPSHDDTLAVRSAIDNLDTLLLRAEASTPIASAMGIRSRRPIVKSSPLTEADAARGKALLAQLEPLPIDELRARLESISINEPGQLRAIAMTVGIRPTQRTNREALVHQIASRIANVRGYEALRRGTETPE